MPRPGSPGDLVDLALSCPPSKLRELMDEAFGLRLARFGRKLYFFAPGMVHYEVMGYEAAEAYRFPAISVTGTACELQCKHCRGRILESMIPAKSPDDLYKLCVKVKESGGRGCLVSGGSLRDGRVPLKEFAGVMRRVKEELGLKVLVHTGLPDRETVKALAEAGVDGVLIDIVGSDETIREVYNLDKRVEDFDQALGLLEEYGVPTVPHVVVGLHYGELRGERRALEVALKHDIKALTVVVLMPLSGTPMERAKPPHPLVVGRILVAARLLLEDKPLLLGCARPRGVYKSVVDALGIRAGVNGLAYPSAEAYLVAERLGLEVEFRTECCSLVWEYV